MLVTPENSHKVMDYYAQSKPDYLAVDTETTGLRWERDRLFLIIVAWGDEHSYVFPENVWTTARWLLETDVPKVFHNAKFDLHFLEEAGFTVKGEIIDTIILAQATGAIGKDKKLNKQLKTLGNHFCPDIDATEPKKALDAWFRKNKITKAERDYSKVPMEIMEPYAKMDGIITHRLKKIFEDRINEVGTQRPSQIDHAVMPVVYNMEKTGIRIDRDLAKQMIDEYTYKEQDAEATLFELSGWQFNPNSDAELKEVLTKLGYTPGQYVDEAALKALGEDDPIIQAVIHYRKVSKTLHTYLMPIYEFSSVTGRLHGSFNITGAYTGRFSSSDPNLQNMPPWVRNLFIPDEGCTFHFYDYSQMELRMAAEYSRDPVMMSAYIGDANTDLHAETAEIIFPNLRSQSEEVFDKWRGKGKQVNFSLIYGAGGRRVANIIGGGMTEQDGRALKSRILDRYEVFGGWFNKVQRVLRSRGYIHNRFGRRYEHVKGYEYRGPNYLVQGTCADIVKIALCRIDEGIREQGLRSRLLSTIHDEIFFNVVPGEEEAIDQLATHSMTHWPELELAVPLVAEKSISKTNWGEKKAC